MAAAAEGVFKCVYEACIAFSDTTIERRPYHRNCSCALHKSRKTTNHCSSHGLPRTNTISYPVRRSRSEGCFSLSTAASTASAQSLPSSSPALAAAASGGKTRWLGCFDEGDEDCVAFLKVGN